MTKVDDVPFTKKNLSLSSSPSTDQDGVGYARNTGENRKKKKVSRLNNSLHCSLTYNNNYHNKMAFIKQSTPGY